MPPEEAKVFLAARRPGGGDDTAPEMREALAAAVADPALAKWLAEEEAFDAAITARLGELETPPDLHARILAGMHNSAPPDRGKFTRRVLLWGSVSAAAAAAAGVVFHHLRITPPDPARFRAEMLDFFNHRFDHRFDLVESDPARLQAWLQSRPQPVPFEIPGNLADGNTLGCRIIPWSGTAVTLVCFMPPGSPELIHVFAVPAASLASPGPPVLNREHVREQGWNTALWAQKGNTYMAISKLPVEALNRYLEA